MVFILIVLLAGIFGFSAKKRWKTVQVDPNKYQVVFIEGNQQYFGHLNGIGTRQPSMTDVYYVNVLPGQENLPNAQKQFSLAKLGNNNEIHGPEDTIYLNWDKVVLWQNLKNESQVVQGILRQKEQNLNAASAPVVAPQQLAPQAPAAAAPATK